MPFLLLLSAILTALTGAIGVRAAPVAQPVEASAPAVVAGAARLAVVALPASRAAASRWIVGITSMPAEAVTVSRAVPLYADRRRE